MQLLTASHPDEPVLDMALSHALLLGVARGELPETARVFRPGPTMAFGRLDALRDGYGAARAAATARGRTPVLRLGGGHAAGYDDGSVVLELITRSARVAEGLQERFADGAGLVVGALEDVGADVEVGELPGEYCAGRWSVHLRGGPKVAGLAQRSVRGAALLTAVVIAEHGARLREALVAVYAELALAWDPSTAGAVEDGASGASAAGLAAALEARLRTREVELPRAAATPSLLGAARALAPEHSG